MLRLVAAVVVGVGLLLTTAARVEDWTDELSLWRAATHTSPQKPRPWMNYGKQLALRGHTSGAELAYREALRVSAVRPRQERRVTEMAAGVNLALLAMQEGDTEQAWRQILAVEREFPTVPQVLEVSAWIALAR